MENLEKMPCCLIEASFLLWILGSSAQLPSDIPNFSRFLSRQFHLYGTGVDSPKTPSDAKAKSSNSKAFPKLGCPDSLTWGISPTNLLVPRPPKMPSANQERKNHLVKTNMRPQQSPQVQKPQFKRIFGSVKLLSSTEMTLFGALNSVLVPFRAGGQIYTSSGFEHNAMA